MEGRGMTIKSPYGAGDGMIQKGGLLTFRPKMETFAVLL